MLAPRPRHAFQRGSGGTRIATVSGPEMRYEGAIEDLLVLRATGSGWAGFHREEYTTLPETDDRILGHDRHGPLGVLRRARRIHLGRRPRHDPRGVRRSLQPVRAVHAAITWAGPAPDRFSAGRALSTSRCRTATTCFYDLERFGLDNPNAVFHSTTEPYGLIEGTVER